MLVLTASLAWAAPTTLCAEGETTWFTCTTTNRKILSVCGSLRAIQYRFGLPGAIELTYPKEPSLAPFWYEASETSHQGGHSVSFSNGGFVYSVFETADMEPTPADPGSFQHFFGVEVRRDEDVVATILCDKRKPATLNLQGLDDTLKPSPEP